MNFLEAEYQFVIDDNIVYFISPFTGKKIFIGVIKNALQE